MREVTTTNQYWMGVWYAARMGTTFVPGAMHYIGLTEDGTLLAVCAYEGYNQAQIQMHIAALPGKRWLVREYLWYCFHYPFATLGVKRVTGIVPASNLEARKFDENLGFTLEATLKDAHPDGDLLVYKMTRDQCRWLTLKERTHGRQIISSTTTRLCSSS